MIARLATDKDRDQLQVAYELADMRCDPEHPAAPHPEAIHSALLHDCLYIAFEGERIVGTALTHEPGSAEVRWLTILGGDPAQVWEALGDAICEVTGQEPHGIVHNPDLRAALLVHERLSEDPEEPQRLRWRRP